MAQGHIPIRKYMPLFAYIHSQNAIHIYICKDYIYIHTYKTHQIYTQTNTNTNK